jgi:hypothetical protein
LEVSTAKNYVKFVRKSAALVAKNVPNMKQNIVKNALKPASGVPKNAKECQLKCAPIEARETQFQLRFFLFKENENKVILLLPLLIYLLSFI